MHDVPADQTYQATSNGYSLTSYDGCDVKL
jgi:hypothetical protein